jgi:hypothetical protein
MGRGRWRIEVDRALRARYFNLEIAMEPKRTGDGPKSLSPRVGGCVPAVTGLPCLQGRKAPTLIERRYTSTKACSGGL